MSQSQYGLSPQQFKILEDLRQHGLELCKPISIKMLSKPCQPRSFWRSLLPLWGQGRYHYNWEEPKKAFKISNSLFAVTHCNRLAICQYIKTEGIEQIIVEDSLQLEGSISSLGNFLPASYEEMVLISMKSVKFVVLYQNLAKVSLLECDKNGKIASITGHKTNDIVMTGCFMTPETVALALRNGVILFYRVVNHKLQQFHSRVSLEGVDSQHSFLIAKIICTHYDTQIIDVCIFYALLAHNHVEFNLTQVTFEPKKSTISMIKHSRRIFVSLYECSGLALLEVYKYKEYFLIKLKTCLLILQRKYGVYQKANIIRNIDPNAVSFVLQLGTANFLGILCGIKLELWELHLDDINVTCKLIDAIELLMLPPQRGKQFPKLIQIWLQLSSKGRLCFLCDCGGKSLQFYETKNVDKLRKIVTAIINTDGGEKEPLREKQELSERLGYSKKDFYLSLWNQAEKSTALIFKYLLPCMDFRVIFEELTMYLKHKPVSVVELIRVMIKIESSALEELKQNLTAELIKTFVKANFQRRKLILFMGQPPLYFEEFQQIDDYSIVDIAQLAIDAALNQNMKNSFSVWEGQKKEVPVSLMSLLREFRLAIFEDYTGFLLRLFKKYRRNIAEVLALYPEMLPLSGLMVQIQMQQTKICILPINGFEVRQNLFDNIKDTEWEKEPCTIDYFYNYLHPHYRNSFIAKTINDISNSQWCLNNKLHKHNLICSTQAEFETALNSINHDKILIAICQFANRVSLQDNVLSEAAKILDIMREYHRLPHEQYHDWKLYARLHRLMVSEKLIPVEMTIMQLKETPKDKMIGYFFMGDLLRHELIFRDVSIYFQQHHKGSEGFKDLLGEFMRSSECSLVELLIILRDLLDKGHSYHKSNQELIGLVITAFSSKIQLRQVDKIAQFLNLINDFSLSQRFICKVSAIEQLQGECFSLLQHFELQTLTYEQILQDPQMIITSIVDNYFRGKIKSQRLMIEGQQVQGHDVFTAVLYLKDKIYSYHSEMELCLFFGLAMLQWEQDDTICEIFNSPNSKVIEQASFSSDEYILQLITRALEAIYAEEDLQFTADIKKHIMGILTLQKSPQNNALVQQEKARLQLVQIFEGWGKAVSIGTLKIICFQWRQDDKDEFIDQILEKFLLQMRFAEFQKMNIMLDIIEEGYAPPNPKTKHFERFCRKIIASWLAVGKCFDSCEVIYYLNENQKQYLVEQNYLIECFLQVLAGQGTNIDQKKQMVDYFLEYFDDVNRITMLFYDKFDPLRIEARGLPLNTALSSKLTNDPTIKSVLRQQIWQLIYSNSSSDTSTVSSYLFLLRSYRQPQSMKNLTGVNYDHNLIISCLTSLISLKKMNFFMYSKFLSLHLRGIILKKFGPQQLRNIQQMRDQHLIRFAIELRAENCPCSDSFRAIKRLITLIKTLEEEELYKKMKASQKRRELVTNIFKAELTSVAKKVQESPLKESITELAEMTISVSKYRAKKRYIQTYMQINSQKEVLEQIFSTLEKESDSQAPSDQDSQMYSDTEYLSLPGNKHYFQPSRKLFGRNEADQGSIYESQVMQAHQSASQELYSMLNSEKSNGENSTSQNHGNIPSAFSIKNHYSNKTPQEQLLNLPVNKIVNGQHKEPQGDSLHAEGGTACNGDSKTEQISQLIRGLSTIGPPQPQQYQELRNAIRSLDKVRLQENYSRWLKLFADSPLREVYLMEAVSLLTAK